MTAPTLTQDAECGCGRVLASHYADADPDGRVRMRGPDCPDFHLPPCGPTCRHPRLRRPATAATTVQLVEHRRAPNSDSRWVHPGATVPAHLREAPLPPAEPEEDLDETPAETAPAAPGDGDDDDAQRRPGEADTAAVPAPLTGLAAAAEATAARILKPPAATSPAAGPQAAGDAPPAAAQAPRQPRPHAAAAEAVTAAPSPAAVTADPEPPRHIEPSPAGLRALEGNQPPAVVGGADAGEEVAAEPEATGAAATRLTTDIDNLVAALTAKRKDLGWSQAELGLRMGITGQYVASLEHGHRGAGPAVLGRWAAALAVELTLTWTDLGTPPPASPTVHARRVAIVRSLAAAGLTDNRIASRIGMSLSWVQQVRAEHGIPGQRPGRPRARGVA